LIVGAQQSEDKPYQYKLYGFVRGELYYNNRSNVEGVDGLFYLFPKDVVKDPDGADLNGYPNGSFYTFATRLGLDIKGPDIGAAKATAKIETDFGGTNNLNFVLRIRQIYLRLAWDKGSSLLLGQTWHPMFGEVMPDMLNLATGAPFQPFNRSPQINYQFNKEHFKLTASAIFQHIYLPVGPDGKTETYAKNALLPEFYLGADYRNGGFLIGSGADLLSLKPRTNATVYRVNERVTSLSYELHAKYHRDGLKLSGKTLLALNQTHNTMLGGFGVTSTDSKTGEQQYVAFKHSTTWLNVVVGKKWQTSCFAGYTKNLGTPKPLESVEKVYGTGLNIDRLLTLNLCFSYNVKHWKLGAEYTRSTAWYGKINVADGKVQDPHAAKNNRIETVFMYFF
jgi:hypothetical protein